MVSERQHKEFFSKSETLFSLSDKVYKFFKDCTIPNLLQQNAFGYLNLFPKKGLISLPLISTYVFRKTPYLKLIKVTK